ncbi:hypothetical protein P67b_00094 [Ruegeria phage Tedan]|nr:hypothetical protein P67b_00094 [Ruegeria phage Tedan]
MAKFGYMDQQQVEAEKVIAFKVLEITMPNGEHPVFYGRMAGEKNKPYFNAVLKTQAVRAKEMQVAGVSSEMLGENRNEDRELFPAHVLTGWEVVDAHGKTVPYSEEDCAEFLAMIPDHAFDRMRNHFSTASNFMGQKDLPPTTEAAVKKGKS